MKKDNNDKYKAIQDEVKRMFLQDNYVPEGVHSIVNNEINTIVCEARGILMRKTENCIAPYEEVVAHINYEMIRKYRIADHDKAKMLMYMTFLVMM